VCDVLITVAQHNTSAQQEVSCRLPYQHLFLWACTCRPTVRCWPTKKIGSVQFSSVRQD